MEDKYRSSLPTGSSGAQRRVSYMSRRPSGNAGSAERVLASNAVLQAHLASPDDSFESSFETTRNESLTTRRMMGSTSGSSSFFSPSITSPTTPFASPSQRTTKVPSAGLAAASAAIRSEVQSPTTSLESPFQSPHKVSLSARRVSLSATAAASTSAEPSFRFALPTATRVPHTRVRPGVSRNVLYSTYHHVVELYGPQMPVLVAESLLHQPGAKTSASVNVNFELAWAWYVYGRRLLIWRIPSYIDTSAIVMAKDLSLPSSDLAHNANLVCVFRDPKLQPPPRSGQTYIQAPSCIAVSPEGIIRYWDIIGNHSSWVDVNANLGGEEVCEVRELRPIGCIAVTTSGTMIIITPTVHRGNPTVTTRIVSQLPSWFGNIGRRVSSIIFGGTSQSQTHEFKVVKMFTSVRVQNFQSILMIDGFTLNSWTIEHEQEVVCAHLYESNIEPVIRRQFPPEVAENPECRLLITDVHASDSYSLVVLVVSEAPRYYMILELDGNDMHPPVNAAKLCVISRNNISVLEGPDGKLAHLKFVLLPSTALVFNNLIIYAVPLSGGDELDGEPLDLPGGVVLGGLKHNTTPVFFSATYGLVSITPVDTACIDVIATSSDKAQATPLEVVSREPSASTTVDHVFFLKTAFVHYIRKNLDQCVFVLKKHFNKDETALIVDSVLAKTFVKVSLDIINDVSPKDYRWGKRKRGARLPGAISLHLATQLIEKMKAHDIFYSFAKDVHRQMDLGMVSTKSRNLKTIHLISEHNDKMTLTMLIRHVILRHPRLITVAINTATSRMHFAPTHRITRTDFFFRYASISDLALIALMKRCVKKSYRNLGSQKFMRYLLLVNKVIIFIMHGVISRRDEKGYFFDDEFIPWLAAPRPAGIYDNLYSVVNVTHDAIIRFGKHSRVFNALMNQFFLLSDILLYVKEKHSKYNEFMTMSGAFINFFMEFNEYFRALQLAFKYRNFEYLIKLCLAMGVESHIKNFVDYYGDQGFCYYLFESLYLRGKYTELLNCDIPDRYRYQLEKYLTGIPVLDWMYKVRHRHTEESFKVILKMCCDKRIILREQYIRFNAAKLTAHALLKKEKKDEKQIVTFEEFINESISDDAFESSEDELEEDTSTVNKGKAEAITVNKEEAAAPTPPSKEEIERSKRIETELEKIKDYLCIIAAQQKIPVDVYERKGYNVATLRMLEPEKVIDLFTCEENFEANEGMFLEALHVAALFEDEEGRNEMRKLIWTRAVLKNNWEDKKKDVEPQVVRDFLFFRLAKLLKDLNLDVCEDSTYHIPPAEAFVEMKLFTEESLGYYLLEYGYEALGIEHAKEELLLDENIDDLPDNFVDLTDDVTSSSDN